MMIHDDSQYYLELLPLLKIYSSATTLEFEFRDEKHIGNATIRNVTSPAQSGA